MKDFYAILDLDRSATAEQIKERYRELSKALHPDVNPACAHLMRELNAAYETLSDPSKRRAYDLKSKVTEIPQQARRAASHISPDGAVNLVGLAEAFIPGGLSRALSPVLSRYLNAQGINPNAATAEQVMNAAGWLPKKRRRKSA